MKIWEDFDMNLSKVQIQTNHKLATLCRIMGEHTNGSISPLWGEIQDLDAYLRGQPTIKTFANERQWDDYAASLIKRYGP